MTTAPVSAGVRPPSASPSTVHGRAHRVVVARPRRRSCSRSARRPTSSASPSSATIRRRRAAARRVEYDVAGRTDPGTRSTTRFVHRVAAGDALYHLDEARRALSLLDLIVTQDLCAVCAVDVAEVDDALPALGVQRRRADRGSDDARRCARVDRGDREGDVLRGPGRSARARTSPPLGIDRSLDVRRFRRASRCWNGSIRCTALGHWVPDLVTGGRRGAGARGGWSAVASHHHRGTSCGACPR